MLHLCMQRKALPGSGMGPGLFAGNTYNRTPKAASRLVQTGREPAGKS